MVRCMPLASNRDHSNPLDALHSIKCVTRMKIIALNRLNVPARELVPLFDQAEMLDILYFVSG